MPEMKRRRFLGVTAATVAMTAIPVLNGGAQAIRWLEPSEDVNVILGDGIPKIGSKFFVWSQFEADSYAEALFKCREYGGGTLRRIEKREGLIFGQHRREVNWRCDHWVVMTTAVVVGYA